jgi:hypothetical protein
VPELPEVTTEKYHARPNFARRNLPMGRGDAKFREGLAMNALHFNAGAD